MGSFSSDRALQPTILTVPGLHGSGPDHWQTLWEAGRMDTLRAELGMWHVPHRNAWVTKLDIAIRSARGPVILAAHSLGCLAVTWWAELTRQPFGRPVAGALLVAPADVDRADARIELKALAPAPASPLPFPSIVVASTDDPWVDLDRARGMAAAWGSHFVNVGAQGHLNADSGIGYWHEGEELLERVIHASGDRSGRPRAPVDARQILTAAEAQSRKTPFFRPRA